MDPTISVSPMLRLVYLLCSKKLHFEFGNDPHLEKFLTPAASLDTSKLEHHKCPVQMV